MDKKWLTVCHGLGKVPRMAEPYDLSPREAAALIGCHEDTLKRWASDGKVRAFKTPGGWWRFRRSDIETLLEAS